MPSIPVLACLVMLSVSIPARADSLPQWEVGAGAAVMRLPDYRGSTTYRNYVLPLPYFVYRGEVLKVDRRGATGVLLDAGRLELDLSASASNPARSRDNPEREGMANLHPTLELGPRLRYRLAASADRHRELTLELPVRAVFALDLPRLRYVGWLANPLINLDWRHVGGSAWTFSAQGGPLWGDRQYHQYFYSVGARDARDGRPEYHAAGGYGGAQLTFALSRRFDRFWVGGFVRGYSLAGATFESSPLVRTSHAVMAGVVFSWIFAQSDKRVLAEE